MTKTSYKEIYEYVKAKFHKTNHFYNGPFDETYFTMRVFESAKEIIKELKPETKKKIKKKQLLVACILHDIGKTKLKSKELFKREGFTPHIEQEWRKHAEYSAEITQKYLKRKKYSAEFIEEAIYLVKNHDKDIPNKTIELKILQDADLLADIGLIGFVRPFLYAGKFKKTIKEQIHYLSGEDRTKKGEKLNLKESKRIAARKIKQQKELTKDLLREIESELV